MVFLKCGKNSFSYWLEEEMKKKKMTSVLLAEKVGISKATISRYLNGKRVPTLDVAIEIAKALGSDNIEMGGFSVLINL